MNDLITIRPATTSDAQDILNIYAPYILETAITYEYDVPTLAEFEGRIAHTLEKYPYLVAIDNQNHILGYAYASPFITRSACDWSVETSIYVDRNCRGRHIGALLYAELERILKAQHIVNACAYICASYEESIAFHHKRGYEIVATFHKSGFKLGRWHDLVCMEKALGAHEVPPKMFVPYPELKIAK
jgi:phosphinothricin acetyltransferase